jgi:hypothetical protein
VDAHALIGQFDRVSLGRHQGERHRYPCYERTPGCGSGRWSICLMTSPSRFGCGPDLHAADQDH